MRPAASMCRRHACCRSKCRAVGDGLMQAAGSVSVSTRTIACLCRHTKVTRASRIKFRSGGGGMGADAGPAPVAWRCQREPGRCLDGAERGVAGKRRRVSAASGPCESKRTPQQWRRSLEIGCDRQQTRSNGVTGSRGLMGASDPPGLNVAAIYPPSIPPHNRCCDRSARPRTCVQSAPDRPLSLPAAHRLPRR